MRTLKRPGRSDRTQHGPARAGLEHVGTEAAEDGHEDSIYETYEMFRVICPDCTRPIALLADEEVLPEHALCQTPWNPFGLTVCTGTGRGVAETSPADDSLDAQEQDAALLLTLPQELDWRTQPFSHVSGPGARQVTVPQRRRRP